MQTAVGKQLKEELFKHICTLSTCAQQGNTFLITKFRPTVICFEPDTDIVGLVAFRKNASLRRFAIFQPECWYHQTFRCRWFSVMKVSTSVNGNWKMKTVTVLEDELHVLHIVPKVCF
jgi:hypothetical protein